MDNNQKKKELMKSQSTISLSNPNIINRYPELATQAAPLIDAVFNHLGSFIPDFPEIERKFMLTAFSGLSVLELFQLSFPNPLQFSNAEWRFFSLVFDDKDMGFPELLRVNFNEVEAFTIFEDDTDIGVDVKNLKARLLEMNAWQKAAWAHEVALKSNRLMQIEKSINLVQIAERMNAVSGDPFQKCAWAVDIAESSQSIQVKEQNLLGESPLFSYRVVRHVAWNKVNFEKERTTKIAQRYGISPATVSRNRTKFAPETKQVGTEWRGVDWSKSNQQIAEETGKKVSTVSQHRPKTGKTRPNINWESVTPEMWVTQDDKTIADFLKCSPNSVFVQRKKLTNPDYGNRKKPQSQSKRNHYDWSKVSVEMLIDKSIPSKAIQKIVGCPLGTVNQRRFQLRKRKSQTEQN